jgi:hypothetical protein
MIVYHGTTERRARRICTQGFLPRKPSRRVWFAKSKAYAEGRARTQARRSHDRRVVLTCDIDLQEMRARLGAERVVHRSGIVAIDAPVPVSVLRSYPSLDQPTSPAELARWVNHLLGLKPYKGVGRRHPGIERLSKWVVNRASSQQGSRIRPAELLRMARQWLPEYFRGVEVDLGRLKVYPKVETIEVAAHPPPADPREEAALRLIGSDRPKQRVRGLKLLAEMEDPDLFDWCAMHLDDEAADVRAAALEMMLRCEDGAPEAIAPLAASADKRIRAGAIAALARHAGRHAARWFERGLRDPSACVRLKVASQLPRLDPARHHAIFELALYDPNPKVAQLAVKLTAGKGFATSAWHRPPRPG